MAYRCDQCGADDLVNQAELVIHTLTEHGVMPDA